MGCASQPGLLTKVQVPRKTQGLDPDHARLHGDLLSRRFVGVWRNARHKKSHQVVQFFTGGSTDIVSVSNPSETLVLEAVLHRFSAGLPFFGRTQEDDRVLEPNGPFRRFPTRLALRLSEIPPSVQVEGRRGGKIQNNY